VCNYDTTSPLMDFRYMGVGLSAGGINLNRLPGTRFSWLPVN